jgi:hypothetical protein
LLPQYSFAWRALPPELAATVLVATGFGAMTAKMAVAKAQCVKHQIAKASHQAPHRRHHRNQGGNHADLAVAQKTNAEVTSTTLGYWMEDSQLARRNVVQLEGSM